MKCQLLVPRMASVGSVSPSNGTDFSLDECYAHLGCEMVEVVDVDPVGGVPHILIVDEEGIPNGGKYNLAASALAGRQIVGSAIHCPADAFR